MYKLEFGIVHRGCIVNEMSGVLPAIRFLCPGGFLVSPTSVDEVLVLDNPSEQDIASVLDYLRSSPKIAESELLERLPHRAVIRMLTSTVSETSCSDAVAKHRCFLLEEFHEGGVEQWKVGCRDRSQAEALVEELKTMGELKFHSISKVSWKALCEKDGEWKVVFGSNLSVDRSVPGIQGLRLVNREKGATTTTAGVATFEPGAAFPLHTHNCEETVIVLEGRARLDIEGQSLPLGKYDTVFARPGVQHRFVNESQEPMSFAYFYPSVDVRCEFVDSSDLKSTGEGKE